MQAGTHSEAKVLQVLLDRLGASNGPRGARKGQNEAISSPVDLLAVEFREFSSNGRFVQLEELLPSRISYGRCFLSRVDNVGYQQRQQNPLLRRGMASTGCKLDLPDQSPLVFPVSNVHQVERDRQQEYGEHVARDEG